MNLLILVTVSSLFLLLTTHQIEGSVEFPLSVIVDLSNLPLDSNNRLAENWLLFLDNPHCQNSVRKASLDASIAHRNIAAYSSEISDSIFGDSRTVCNAVYLVKGTSIDLLQYALPDNMITISDGADSDQLILDWMIGRQDIEVGWISHFPSELTLYWINPESNERIYNGRIQYGEKNTLWLRSRLGHKFEIVDDNDVVIEKYTMEHDSFNVVGASFMVSRTQQKDVTSAVEHTFDQEWRRSHNVKRTFTDLGFTLGKLPKDLWASIQAYYYNNRVNKVIEEWEDKGIFVNWWEADVYMIGMPWGLKRYWQARLQTLVEEWSGVELELTDIYGMRRYEEGARLLAHVDREDTHAASLIINVAQGGVREPWAVEIYDFANRLHEITMDEGDIIYYESARCLHARMKPLQGAFYVNLFAHYRPIGDPNWHRKENTAEDIPQLLDIGDCHVGEKNAVNCSKVEIRRIPYLSPSLETLNGPQDLFKYWLQTAPSQAILEAPLPNEEL